MNTYSAMGMIAAAWLFPTFISFVPIFLGWYATEKHLEVINMSMFECSLYLRTCLFVSGETSHWGPFLPIRPQRSLCLHLLRSHLLVPRDHHARRLLLGLQGGHETEEKHGEYEQYSDVASDKELD